MIRPLYPEQIEDDCPLEWDKVGVVSQNSHVGGKSSSVSGTGSFAYGIGVKTVGNNQVAFGKYNEAD
jgi:hypothetical protein